MKKNKKFSYNNFCNHRIPIKNRKTGKILFFECGYHVLKGYRIKCKDCKGVFQIWKKRRNKNK